MSGGRSRRKKLVRSKRLSKTDSEVEVEQENINGGAAAQASAADSSAANQELLEAEQAEEAAEAGSEQPPPLETVSESGSSSAALATPASLIDILQSNILQLDNLDAELAGMYIFPKIYLYLGLAMESFSQC